MGTLVHDPFHEAVPDLFGLDLDAYYAEKDHASYLAFERGELSIPAYAEVLFSDRRPVDLAALEARYRRDYRLLPGIEALLDELVAAGVKMHALSNYGPFWEWIEEEVGLSRWVPWTFVSARTGLRKAAPAAYLHASTTLSVTPEACLFVDDREKNCAGARDVGMRAVRFTDASALRPSLVAEGFLPPR
jgi:HAD superfamily hydrolase (TIGR01509 family)